VKKQHKLTYKEKECSVCKQLFRYNSKQAKYCSIKCKSRAQALRKNTKNTCKQCNMEFKAERSRVYCSVKCSLQFRKKTRTIKRDKDQVSEKETDVFKHLFTCLGCKEKLYAKTRKRLYCSCSCKAFKRKVYSYKCSECKTSFSSTKHTALFCSTACSSKAMHRKKKSSTIICKRCGCSVLSKGALVYCGACSKERKKERDLAAHYKNNPNAGKGTGGVQWGKDNNQWNPYSKYHFKEGYTVGYKPRCYVYWEKSCVCCGKTPKDKTIIDVHHIDGDRENRDKYNLIPLCRQCHSKVHHQKNNIYKNTCDYKQALTAVVPLWEQLQSQVVGTAELKSRN